MLVYLGIYYSRIPKRVLVQRFSFRNGDPEGTRTPDLQRDRLAFYATELRSHISCSTKDSNLDYAYYIRHNAGTLNYPGEHRGTYKIDFSLNLYVYIISEISIKIKLFLSKFSF